MRKIFSEPRHKRHSRKRSFAELRKRQTRGYRQFDSKPVLGAYKNVRAPRNLDLTNNTTEVLNFFERFRSLATARFRVHLDMSGVEFLAPDAILYLLSELENFDPRLGYHIEGTSPTTPWCADLLYDSGFYNYVESSIRGIRPFGQRILSVKQGIVAEPSAATALKHFAVKHTGGTLSALEARAVFATIVECMANTVNHAYRTYGSPRTWRMLAAVFEMADGTKRIRFAFHDNGIGIPTTMRRKKIFDRITGDAALIEAAMTQANRSETNLSYRGKGLRKIHEFQRKGLITNFAIMSRQGVVNFANNSKRELLVPFRGTLLIWDFL